MLPLHYGRVLWFLKDSNPHRFIRSEECYPLHQRTIVTPDRFELPLSGPKPLVLPLDDGVLSWNRRTRTAEPFAYQANALPTELYSNSKVGQTGIEPVPTDFQSAAMTSSATAPI